MPVKMRPVARLLSSSTPEEVSPWLPQRGSWATRSPTGRRFLQMLAASLLVHALLTPFPAWLGVLGVLAPPKEDLPPEDTLTGIPVDLIADEPIPEPAVPEPAPPPPAAAA